MTDVTALVLCGGASRRFGSDKTRADLHGRALLEHVLVALPDRWPVVCVGTERPTQRTVTWTRERPPGGGPVAGLAAGLASVATPLVVVLGGDMPYAAPATERLVTALEADLGVDAVAATDARGRTQPLLAAYRVPALATALPTAPAGTPLMRVLDRLRVAVLPLPGDAVLDVDTPEDLERARHRLHP
jgi:molybdopterin-guanine dinucleotide biosynthesis protein A